MEKPEIIRLIQIETKKLFSKRLGDTPTDALQLANKKYVDAHSGGSGYAGQVASNAAGTPFPSGWSVTRNSAGSYTITHNLNTTSYAPMITISGSNQTTIYNVSSRLSNSFTVVFYNQTAATTWSAADTDFFFKV